MTSWCGAGSPTRYYQCPFCKRTLCSAYGEVFEHGTLGRKVVAAPEATPDEKNWRELKGRATRWFARLEAEGRRREPAAGLPVVAVAASRVRA
jgi:hypothetical protein